MSFEFFCFFYLIGESFCEESNYDVEGESNCDGLEGYEISVVQLSFSDCSISIYENVLFVYYV